VPTPITEYAGSLKLVWDRIQPRAPQAAGKCHFCLKDILDNEGYHQMKEITNESGTSVFNWKTASTPMKACKNCGILAGLEW